MTLLELQQILARCEATTGGPWRSFVEGRDHESGCDFIQTAKEDIELSGYGCRSRLYCSSQARYPKVDSRGCTAQGLVTLSAARSNKALQCDVHAFGAAAPELGRWAE